MTKPKAASFVLQIAFIFAGVTSCTENPDGVGVSASSGSGGGGFGGEGGFGGGGFGGEGGAPSPFIPSKCEATVVSHDGACPEPCAIATDVEITCESEIGAMSRHIDLTIDATWVTATSNRDRQLLRLDAMGLTRVGDDVLPVDLANAEMQLAFSPSGELHIICDTSKFIPPPGTGGLLHFVQSGGSWVQETVVEANGSLHPVNDFAFDAMGVPHVWFGVKGPETRHGTLDAAGKWAVDVPAVPSSSPNTRRFVFAVSGQIAAFGVDNGVGNNDALRSLVDGAESIVGATSGTFAVTRGPLPSAPALSPPFAVALRQTGGIQVVWPEGDSFKYTALPASPALDMSCSLVSGPCNTDCNQIGTGVPPAALAIARTGDGVVWVAYGVESRDMSIHYEGGCTNPNECGCRTNITSDTTSDTLHLIRVPTDGTAPKEVLTLPIKRLAFESTSTDFYNAGYVIEMQALNTELALLLRTSTNPTSASPPGTLRVLRLDTLKLPQ